MKNKTQPISQPKIRVKVFKTNYKDMNYCEECGSRNIIIQGITFWNEVTLEEYQKLSTAIQNANQWNSINHRGDRFYYFIIQESLSELTPEIFDSAQKYIDWVNTEEKKRQDRIKTEKKKRDSTSLQRKQRQLERLQKELGVKK